MIDGARASLKQSEGNENFVNDGIQKRSKKGACFERRRALDLKHSR